MRRSRTHKIDAYHCCPVHETPIISNTLGMRLALKFLLLWRQAAQQVARQVKRSPKKCYNYDWDRAFLVKHNVT